MPGTITQVTLGELLAFLDQVEASVRLRLPRAVDLQAELAESVEELTEHKDYWAHWTGFPTLRLDAPEDVEEMRARLRRILSDSNESRLLDLAQDAAELSLTTAEFSRNTMSALPGDPSIDPPPPPPRRRPRRR